MKKFFALICMITCIFGLTACGSEETLTEYEQQKVDYAEQLAAQKVVPLLANFMDDDAAQTFAENTNEEIEYIFGNDYSMNVDGYALASAIESYHSAAADIGSITAIGEAEGRIDDDQIIVYVQVEGEKKDAEAEVIFSNDMFMVLESSALNPVSSMGELMMGATLNTLVGMGTVFCVLILICLIISCFGVFAKMQTGKKNQDEKEEKKPAVESPAQQTAVLEATAPQTDDLELIAVIAAAIAASEGKTSTDGFVVRSIRKVRRSRY